VRRGSRRLPVLNAVHESGLGPWLPTCALRQVGSYPRYTGHQHELSRSRIRAATRSERFTDHLRSLPGKASVQFQTSLARLIGIECGSFGSGVCPKGQTSTENADSV
jgi:hypothetical protein